MGLTGIGGGSFTVPALVLIVGLPAGDAVGTAFVFAGVLRLIAAPFYLAGATSTGAILWLLLLGAVPGLLIGTYFLRLLSSRAGSPVVVILLGLLLTASSSVTLSLACRIRNFAHKNSALAALAGAAHWSRIWIFFRRRRRAGHGAAAQLFRDDAAGSRRHRYSIWTGAGRYRQRLSLAVRLDQRHRC